MFDCIICAAGASSRMGAFKPLLPFRGSTVVETVAGAARRAGCRVLLVVGNRGAEVARPFALADGIEIVANGRWELGLLSSIQEGTVRVRGEAFFIMHADMPFVDEEIYLRLAGEMAGTNATNSANATTAPGPAGAANPIARDGDSGGTAYVAARLGRLGHPVLLPSAWIPEIRALPPEGRLRDFLAAKSRVPVESGSDAVLVDLDTPEEYRRATESEESARFPASRAGR